MKKTILALSLLQTVLMVSCGGPQPGQISPYATQPGMGMGMNDPYGGGFNNTAPIGGGYTDPYGGGLNNGGFANDPYGSGFANDPYNSGMNNGYANDPYNSGMNGGMNNGYANDPYGNGFNGLPTNAGPGYGAGMNNGMNNGVPQIDPVTGQPIYAVSQASQQIISKIQAAGGYKARKADDEVRASLKAMSIPQALGQAPLDHRSLIIKTLLDGYAGKDDRSYAMQVWNTILPQDQQRLMSQDSELNKLVTDKLLKDSSGGIGSIFSEAKKLVGLGK